MLQHNADVEARKIDKKTPLHDASLNNSTEVAQLLLQHNANIEARDENNRTPLHDATSSNSPRMVQLLLEHNADTEAKDEDNGTPLHAALYNSIEVVQLLLEMRLTLKREKATVEHLFTMLHQATAKKQRIF